MIETVTRMQKNLGPVQKSHKRGQNFFNFLIEVLLER